MTKTVSLGPSARALRRVEGAGSAAAPKAGRQLGRYALLARLGVGGMASVYLARALGGAGFEKLVAVKVIHAHLADDPELIRLFLDEARATASLHHPNVVATLDLGEDSAVPYIVFELVEGHNLAELIRAEGGERLPTSAALQILLDAAAGLEAAHAAVDAEGQPRPIVHRDISPHNVLVGVDGWVKIGDFGVHKVMLDHTRTRPGELRGKIQYMAPEQARSERVDPRTDLFALGAIAAELLTGARLYQGASELEILARLRAHQVPQLRVEALAPGLPDPLARGLVALVNRLLAPDPAGRFEHAADVQRELRQLRALCPGSLEPRRELATLAQRRFGSRVEYMRKLAEQDRLRERRDGAIRRGPPTRSWDVVDLDAVGPAGADEALGSPRPATTPAGAGPRRPWSTLAFALAAAGLGALAYVAVDALRAGSAAPEPPPEASAPRAPAPSPAPETVRWYLSTQPEGAAVIVAGERYPALTPTSIEVPRGGEPIEVRLERAGFQPIVLTIAPLADQSFPQVLTPIDPAGPVPAPVTRVPMPTTQLGAPGRRGPRGVAKPPAGSGSAADSADPPSPAVPAGFRPRPNFEDDG